MPLTCNTGLSLLNSDPMVLYYNKEHQSMLGVAFFFRKHEKMFQIILAIKNHKTIANCLNFLSERHDASSKREENDDQTVIISLTAGCPLPLLTGHLSPILRPPFLLFLAQRYILARNIHICSCIFEVTCSHASNYHSWAYYL